MISTQTVLRVRRGDGLTYMDDPRLHFVVIAARRTPGGVIIETEVTAGMRAVGVPSIGDRLDLADGAPEFDRVVSNRVQLAKRLQVLPATHADQPLPAVPAPVPSRSDPIVAVEDLR
jgi:hypothetical protein